MASSFAIPSDCLSYIRPHALSACPLGLIRPPCLAQVLHEQQAAATLAPQAAPFPLCRALIAVPDFNKSAYFVRAERQWYGRCTPLPLPAVPNPDQPFR